MGSAQAAEGTSAGARACAPRPAGAWIPLLCLGGIRVYVDALVLGLAALVILGGRAQAAWGERFLLLGIALGSVLLHELAHALMARARGLRVGGVYLHLVPFAYVERGTPRDELRTALAGPALNLVIAGALLACPAVHHGFPWLTMERWLDEPLWAAFGINALMGVLNLIPALPADGGRVLRAALLLRMAPGAAYAITARVGTFTGAFCVFLAVLLWPSSDAIAALVVGAFFVIVAWREFRQGQVERRRERGRARSAEAE